MGKNLYIANLAATTTEHDLRTLFAAAGFEPLSVQIMTDRETGQSRGFGFVEVSEGAAETAIKTLHGKELGGRTLAITEARERPGGDGGGTLGGRSPERGDRPSRRSGRERGE
jgi:cold-inducible RNA-binding protein